MGRNTKLCEEHTTSLPFLNFGLKGIMSECGFSVHRMKRTFIETYGCCPMCIVGTCTSTSRDGIIGQGCWLAHFDPYFLRPGLRK